MEPEAPKKKSKQACGLCGKDPAEGFATIDDVRYCHGDGDFVEKLLAGEIGTAHYAEPTCYMKASWGRT